MNEHQVQAESPPRVVVRRLLALAALLVALWFLWAILRPWLGPLSPTSDAIATLSARLAFWVLPSSVYLARSYGRGWSEPLGLRFPYGSRQVVRALVLTAFLAFFLILGAGANSGRSPVEITRELLLELRPRVAAPILEELVFRGVLTSEALTWARESAPHFRSLLPRFWAVQAGASLIFTCVHWPSLVAEWGAMGAVAPSLSLFVTGLVLGFVFAQTRSIYPCIFLHFLNNELSSLS